MKLSEMRSQAISILGGKCIRCGCVKTEILHIDHINDDGSIDRKNGIKGAKLYKLIISGRTEKYQLLCPNCNWEKALNNKRRSSGRPRKPKQGRSISLYLSGETLDALGPDYKKRVLEMIKSAAPTFVEGVRSDFREAVKEEAEESVKVVPLPAAGATKVCPACGKANPMARLRCLYCTGRI